MNINRSPNHLKSRDIFFGALKIAGLAMTMFGISFFAGHRGVTRFSAQIIDELSLFLSTHNIPGQVNVDSKGVSVYAETGQSFFVNIYQHGDLVKRDIRNIKQALQK